MNLKKKKPINLGHREESTNVEKKLGNMIKKLGKKSDCDF